MCAIIDDLRKMKLSFNSHCKIALFIRTLMIVYSAIHDKIFEVKYTDIDYKVFTDAASHVMNGRSPFDRYTYRYSPLLAYLLVPNLFLHPAWGKFIFSCCDVCVGVLIRRLLKIDKISESTIIWCSYFWLYNPVSIIISSRGNADSIASILVLSTLLAMRNKKYALAGFLHGLSVHFRIYPIAFSFCMYLCIPYTNSKIKINPLLRRLVPNYDKLKLVFSCVITLLTVTVLFYFLYGYTFLHESFLYHLNRRDIRHNFSIYFYLQYLSSISDGSTIQRVLIGLPLFTLLSVISFFYGSRNHLYFCHLLISFIMVTYNTVLTCQYFIWTLCLVPLVLPRLKFSGKEFAMLATLWIVAQLAWLLPAYLLEFKNQNTFIHLWFQGTIFFCNNIFVVTRLIKSYNKRFKFKFA